MQINSKRGASQIYLGLEKALVTSVLTCAVAIAILIVPQLSTASYLVESLEEAQQTEGHYFQAQFVPTYLQAMRSDENTGNYTEDLISYTPLTKRQGTVGDTTMVIWINSVGLFGGLQSAGAMRDKSGLLWDTNDIGTDTSATSILVLGVEQQLLDDQLTLGFGKLFPGQYFLENPYNANNSDTFQNKLISGNPVTAMWESIGIGIVGQYRWQNIFTQFGIIDATAQEEIDFSSFFNGGNTWVWEWGWQETMHGGEQKVSAAIDHVDDRDDYESEQGITINAVYEWPNTQHAVFGRYT
jgi:carbohydrate-selective porin OprB